MPSAEQYAPVRVEQSPDFIPEVMTGEQVWKLLQIGRASWFRLLAADRGPRPVRLGRSVRYRRAEVLGWLARLQRAGGR